MANTTLNISLPEQMREWIDQQVESGEYSNNSDYVRDLIRQDRKRREKVMILQEAIDEGLSSGDGGIFDLESIKTLAKEGLDAKTQTNSKS